MKREWRRGERYEVKLASQLKLLERGLEGGYKEPELGLYNAGETREAWQSCDI